MQFCGITIMKIYVFAFHERIHFKLTDEYLLILIPIL